jgi:hypothetical protein
MIAYINVFAILAVLCLLILPVVLFLHVPQTPMAADHAVIGE